MSKFKRALCVWVISFILINALSTSSAFAIEKALLFKPNMAGRLSSEAGNTILNGPSAPSKSDGIGGDFYIDTKAFVFYGPKNRAGWTSFISLRGPQGKIGIAGTNGIDGKSLTSNSGVGIQGLAGPAGPKGETGAQGIQGVAGSQGITGSAGATGAAGIAGAVGTPGAAGSSGSNGFAGANGAAGAQGSSGAVGSIGLTGPAGAVGPTGNIGATGSAGAVGPSNVYQGPISFAFPIQGTSGSSQVSSAFGTFEAGKSYVLRIHIETYNIAQLVLIYPLSLTISGQGSTPVVSFSYSVANGSFWVAGIRRDEVSINADITLDGSAVASNYSLLATVTCGTNTSSFPITISGTYLGILVGQVTQTS